MAKKGAAHHGGAWKVAYADFVTAMMALFMVLWICEQSPDIRNATSRYFQDPYTALPKHNSGFMDAHMAGTDKTTQEKNPDAQTNEGFLRAIARDFQRLLNVSKEDENTVEVQVTDDGLKMTIYNRTKNPIFKGNTAEFTEWGNFVVQTLAWLIERYEFRVFIDGHTPKNMQAIRPEYGSWELSADRANAARRSLEYFAVNPKKIERVTGFGDTAPIEGSDPVSENNHRITVSLSILQKPVAKPSPVKADSGATAKTSTTPQPPTPKTP